MSIRPIYFSEYLPPTARLYTYNGKYYLQYRQYFVEVIPTVENVNEALEAIRIMTKLNNQIVWC